VSFTYLTHFLTQGQFVFLCFLCIFSYLFCLVSTSGNDCLGRLISEMTYYVASRTHNSTYSFTLVPVCCSLQANHISLNKATITLFSGCIRFILKFVGFSEGGENGSLMCFGQTCRDKTKTIIVSPFTNPEIDNWLTNEFVNWHNICASKPGRNIQW